MPRVTQIKKKTRAYFQQKYALTFNISQWQVNNFLLQIFKTSTSPVFEICGDNFLFPPSFHSDTSWRHFYSSI